MSKFWSSELQEFSEFDQNEDLKNLMLVNHKLNIKDFNNQMGMALVISILFRGASLDSHTDAL